MAKLPGKQETGKEVALAGELLLDVARFLEMTYGIDPALITTKAKGKAVAR